MSKLGKDILIGKEELNRLNDIVLRAKGIVDPNLSYRQVQQALTIQALQEYIEGLGITCPFGLDKQDLFLNKDRGKGVDSE